MYGDVYQITWEGKMHNPDGKPYSSGAAWRIKALLSECCFYIRGWPEGRDSSSSACSQLDTRWTEVWTGPCNDNSLSFKGERQHVRFDGGGTWTQIQQIISPQSHILRIHIQFLWNNEQFPWRRCTEAVSKPQSVSKSPAIDGIVESSALEQPCLTFLGGNCDTSSCQNKYFQINSIQTSVSHDLIYSPTM